MIAKFMNVLPQVLSSVEANRLTTDTVSVTGKMINPLQWPDGSAGRLKNTLSAALYLYIVQGVMFVLHLTFVSGV